MIVFEIIIVVFSKYSDTSGKTFSHYFGILSSGIFFWFFIAILILCLSKTRKLFNLYYLSFIGAILLIILSVIITLVAGIIPARMANHKDPVEALRTE